MLTIRSRCSLWPALLLESPDGYLWGTAQLTDYGENYWIDHMFRTRTLSKPTHWYVGLFTAGPTDAGGGTEVTGGSYARVDLAPLDANWTATQGGTSGNSSGTSGLTSNALAITFPAPTANWGTVTHYGLFDASTGGNLWVWDLLTTDGTTPAPRTILSGDPAPQFAVGALQISIG